jgi:hypothetical protein
VTWRCDSFVGTCGNGVLDPSEDCDLSSPSGAFCPPSQVCDSSCDCVFLPTTTTPTTSSTTTTTLLNHFQCYEAKRMPVTAGPVTVQDQFGTTQSVTLSKPNRLCAPTNKRNEDPTAPTDPDHLKSWQDKHTRPKVINQVVVNQFGSLTLDITRPSFLLVPASKSLAGNPPPLAGPTVDHFQCYKVKRSRGSAKFVKVPGVPAADQFGSYTVDLLRPRWLCAPANKSGEDPTAPSHPEHLLCYKTRTQRFTRRTVFATDQFGSQALDLLRRIELCVPSAKNPGATTTSTAPPTTSTSSTVVTTTVTTTSEVATTSSTSSTTSTTRPYGSASRAFVEPVHSLLD